MYRGEMPRRTSSACESVALPVVPLALGARHRLKLAIRLVGDIDLRLVAASIRRGTDQADTRHRRDVVPVA